MAQKVAPLTSPSPAWAPWAPWAPAPLGSCRIRRDTARSQRGGPGPGPWRDWDGKIMENHGKVIENDGWMMGE